MDIVWNDPENVSHLKSIALTVLELLAFNAPTVCLTGLLHTHTDTLVLQNDAQSDKYSISTNSLLSLGRDREVDGSTKGCYVFCI